MNVIKRNGMRVHFDITRILLAIGKAYAEFPEKELSEENKKKVVDYFETLSNECEEISVEEIQDRVQRLLVFIDFDVALAYILYRYKHADLRLLADRANYISEYIHSNDNAATGSEVDANANSTLKNIASLQSEVFKKLSIDLLRYIIGQKGKEIFPDVDLYGMYLKDLVERKVIYKHDEATPVVKPYCVAINNYQFLFDGTSKLDGLNETAPHTLESYVGQYCNLIFLISSQFLGAVADAGFFVLMNYYLVKEFGVNYINELDDVVYQTKTRTKTIKDKIEQTFQGVVYGINQPSSNRSNQSPFTNISYYDKFYYEALFGEYMYPDGTRPSWEQIDTLQKMFMKWFNKERTKTLLTFPVETMALLHNGKECLDSDYENFTAEMYAEGHSFFTYLSSNADSLSSCCRLRNSLEKNTFSFTNGNIGVATGSKSVITLNLNRIVQMFFIEKGYKNTISEFVAHTDELKGYLCEILDRVYKYHIVYNELLWEAFDANMLSVYSNGFISLNQQFLTIGINGLNESAMFLGIECNDNEDYKLYCNTLLDCISDSNRAGEAKYQPLTPKHKIKFNTEFVPAEGLGVKNYNRDKEDGYWVPEGRNCYTSYFFLPDDEKMSALEMLKLHGEEYASKCDGGMACHINLMDNLDKKQYKKLLHNAIELGTNYFTFNVPQTQCDKCGFIAKKPFHKCPKCGSEEVTFWTRIIGYLRPVKLFSAARRKEAAKRVFNSIDSLIDKGKRILK